MLLVVTVTRGRQAVTSSYWQLLLTVFKNMVARLLVVRGKEKSLQEAHVLLLRLVTVEHPSRTKDALNPAGAIGAPCTCFAILARFEARRS